jgi:ABC-type xylose transport system permease subunit
MMILLTCFAISMRWAGADERSIVSSLHFTRPDGGTSLFGGRGSIVGTMVGALIVGVFRSAVSLAGLDVLWQEFAIGVLIIVAVALDQWIRRIAK